MPERELPYAYAQIHNWTHLLVFPSQDLCDGWWRSCQDRRHKTRGSAEPWDIKRVGPQYYIFGNYTSDIPLGAPSTEEKFIILYIGGPYQENVFRCLPPPSRIDYLNRKAYYVRSLARPKYFWSVDSQREKTINLSKQPSPIKFIIQRANPLPYDCEPQEDILIGSDEVTLTPILAGGAREPIVLNGTNLQANTDAPIFKFKFGLLTNEGGFAIWPGSSDVHFSVDGMGDEWELVC